MINHYLVLGAHAGLEDLEIRALYRVLARQHHPDRGGDAAQFAAVTAAYAATATATARAKLAGLYALAAPPCSACTACGYRQRQKGFTGVERSACTACGGAGYLLEQAAKPRSYRRNKP